MVFSEITWRMHAGPHGQGAGDAVVQVPVGDVPLRAGYPPQQLAAGGAVRDDCHARIPILPHLQAHHRVPPPLRYPAQPPRQPQQVRCLRARTLLHDACHFNGPLSVN